MPAFIDLTKRKFGRLVVIERARNAKRSCVLWRCRCDCGNIVVIRSTNLRSGNTQSCGCLQKEIVGKIFTKHGMRRAKEYEVWTNMLKRCNNPKSSYYYNYGGRGITVCEKWLKFVGFFEDMGSLPKGLTLERRNNDKGYYKENCYWADYTTQSRNQRIRKDNKTGVRGIWWDKAINKYYVSIGVESKCLYIGRFAKLEQATKARKDAELKYWG